MSGLLCAFDLPRPSACQRFWPFRLVAQVNFFSCFFLMNLISREMSICLTLLVPPQLEVPRRGGSKSDSRVFVLDQNQCPTLGLLASEFL